MPRRLDRQEIIVELIRTLPDVVTYSDAGVRGAADSRCFELPRAYHEGSYRELEDMMRRLRDEVRPFWWHVVHRYERCHRRTCSVKVRRGPTGRAQILGLNGSQEPLGMPTEDPHAPDLRYRVVIEEWDAGVDVRLARAGIAWLDRHWRGRPPQLPVELWRMVAA